MKLTDINPFLIRNNEERKRFTEVYQKEVKEYRKKIPFWGGLLIAFVFTLILIYRLDNVGRLILFPIMLGSGLAHDIIVGHLVGKIIKLKDSN